MDNVSAANLARLKGVAHQILEAQDAEISALCSLLGPRTGTTAL